MAVALEDIKKLRALTGAGLGDCKKALAEANGNMEEAIEIIRKKGQAVAAKRSDRVIITSDNPRFEEPQDIINDMLAGLDAEQMQKTISICDRREAIRAAAMMARPGDVILVAGKGHEPYQDVKGVKHHFDDHEEIKKAFGLM